MKLEEQVEILEVLSCDIGSRPAGAPGPAELERFVTGRTRDEQTVTYSFRPEGLAAFEAFAAAERVCCSGLTWTVDAGRGALVIEASAEQLDALERIFT